MHPPKLTIDCIWPFTEKVWSYAVAVAEECPFGVEQIRASGCLRLAAGKLCSPRMGACKRRQVQAS